MPDVIKTKMDISIDFLPEEVMIMIFHEIDVYDLINSCSLVSKDWFNFVARSNRIRLNIKQDSLQLLPPLRLYKNLRISNLSTETSINITPQLQTILEDCQDLHIMEIEPLHGLLKFIKNLQCLTIFCCTCCDLSILHQLALLKELHLIGMGHNDNIVSFDTLGPMPEMQKLQINDLKISDESMQQLVQSLPHLECLELNDVTGCTSSAFLTGDGLGALNRLHTLSLPASVITDGVVQKMYLPRLQKLCLFKQKNMQTSESAITDTLAKNCPILKVIHGTRRRVRFERDPNTDKFQPTFDSAATDSTVDPNEIYHMLHVHPEFDVDVDDDVDDDDSDFLFDNEL